MGQYHFLCNLDKREFLDPHKFDEGLKQLEFSSGQCSILYALSYLLSFAGETRGGGDFQNGKHKGQWHGDRISMIGDYAEDTDNPNFKEYTDGPWQNREGWKDISIDVLIDIIRNDQWFAENFHNRIKDNTWFLSREPAILKRVKDALASQGVGEKATLNRDSRGRFSRKPVEV